MKIEIEIRPQKFDDGQDGFRVKVSKGGSSASMPLITEEDRQRITEEIWWWIDEQTKAHANHKP